MKKKKKKKKSNKTPNTDNYGCLESKCPECGKPISLFCTASSISSEKEWGKIGVICSGRCGWEFTMKDALELITEQESEIEGYVMDIAGED